ncbi:hypothetical protein IQ276_023015 [Desmonostoc muscorum LEGE 12446]|uniref:hypothetical protein n=1 Tax=Desmonostoc muscorum TaxID=1179 RepID=UPI001D14E846|nr:hypothetical protein [Desmonostoc muscorum]MCF2149245.1 hypothetical protein [Desmonostoc muscorum LEGE 12446]
MSDRTSQRKKSTASNFTNPSLVSRNILTLANPIRSFGSQINTTVPQTVTEVVPDLQEAQSADEQSLEPEAIKEKPLTHDISRIPLRRPQAKLTVGQPDDKYEQQAEMMANQVMSMPDSGEQLQLSDAECQIQRQCGVDQSCPEEMMDTPRESSSADMTSADASMSVAPEANYTTGSDDNSDTEAQVASFKRLVLTTARARLASNRVNLAQWRNVVEELQLDRQQQLAIQVAQLQETVERRDGFGQSALEQYLTERNPIRRETRLHQTEGRYTACTGCHAEQWATRLENETPSLMQTGPDWQPVADRLTGVESSDRQYLEPWLADYSMPSLPSPQSADASEEEAIRQWLAQTSGESLTARDGETTATRSQSSSREHEDTPNFDLQQAPQQDQMEQINAITESYRAIIQALGPEGYQVWTDSAIAWDSENIEAVRQAILAQIDQRQSDYLELMTMIANGDREYLEFAPILQELLPIASPAVREVIQAEIDAEQDQNLLEAIIVGVATLGLLLLTIFPPSTAIGIAGLAALEVGLGAHAIASGMESFDQGYAYNLATGADDVYSREQQQSGGSMMFGGFISIVTGPLMMGMGSLRGIGAGARIMEGGALAEMNASEAISEGAAAVFSSGEAATLGPRTVRQGQFILSYEADGTVVATVEGNPNIMMIAREGEAIMYERTADGLRVVQRTRITGGQGPAGFGDEIGQYSGRPFNPSAAGGEIRELNYQNVRVTHRGVDVVEGHTSRFHDPEFPAASRPNQFMIDRLRRIASGEMEATAVDLRYYTHELREYVRYRRLGFRTGVPEGDDARHMLWNDTHTATLEDYGLPADSRLLYHPDAPSPW